jgi:hypothetical protein
VVVYTHEDAGPRFCRLVERDVGGGIPIADIVTEDTVNCLFLSPSGPRALIVEVSRSHSRHATFDRTLSKSDRPVAETST